VLYVVDAAGSAQLKKIEVLLEVGSIAVVKGVAAGDRIVVEGKQNLRPGQKVREAPAAETGKGGGKGEGRGEGKGGGKPGTSAGSAPAAGKADDQSMDKSADKANEMKPQTKSP
jgi:hypothetical protein